MKVLWHVNLLPPEIEEELGLAHCVGGSWLIGLRNALLQYGIGVQLCEACCYYGITDLAHTVKDGIEYYAVPMELAEWGFQKIIAAFQPDILHLHGTESANAYLMAKEMPPEKVVTGIQGVMFECAEHYFDGIPEKYKKLSPVKQLLADRVGSVLMQCQYKLFVDGRTVEEEILRRSGSVIGRTRWDRQCAHAINAYAQYYSCNEILRTPFYTGEWQYAECEPHSLYISQAHYPIKGAHMLYCAMGIVIKKYPDTKLYIGGWPPPKSVTRLRQIASNYLEEYRSYLCKLAKQNLLEGHIFYIGPLSEEEVKQQLLKTNVFVSPSSIENESNALSEAKMLGVPSIVSAVGGVKDRIDHGKDGYLYDFYDVDSLAGYICELFADAEKCRAFSAAARENAAKVNNVQNNVCTLVEIYEKIQCRAQTKKK